MDTINLRDPSSLPCRIYIGHLNDSITQEMLDIRFSAHGKIVGFLQTAPAFAFVQYEQVGSAMNAIQAENGSFLAGQQILVKAAEMKSQKYKLQTSDFAELQDDEPMNKKPSDVNHCEIIVKVKDLTSYAEDIARQLEQLEIRVGLLFPNDQVPINKILGCIQSRGCLFAIRVEPANIERNSLTLNMLYGDTVEHRNMPLEDAIRFIYKEFSNMSKNVDQHPDEIQAMLEMLGDNRSLTVLQYDHLIRYLSQRREAQRKMKIGEGANGMDYGSVNNGNIDGPSTSAHQDDFTSNPYGSLNDTESIAENSNIKCPEQHFRGVCARTEADKNTAMDERNLPPLPSAPVASYQPMSAFQGASETLLPAPGTSQSTLAQIVPAVKAALPPPPPVPKALQKYLM